MKALFRTSALAAALALSALAMAGHAFANGNCHFVCYNPTTHMFTQANATSTQAQCCSGTLNPCPPGYSAGLPTYSPPTPPGGSPQRCPF